MLHAQRLSSTVIHIRKCHLLESNVQCSLRFCVPCGTFYYINMYTTEPLRTCCDCVCIIWCVVYCVNTKSAR